MLTPKEADMLFDNIQNMAKKGLDYFYLTQTA